MPRRSDSLGSERDSALRDRVVVQRQANRESLEQGVERRELRSFDVSVGNLALAVEIEAVGEAGFQRLGDLHARLLW
jgi:hypothetical protein